MRQMGNVSSALVDSNYGNIHVAGVLLLMYIFTMITLATFALSTAVLKP